MLSDRRRRLFLCLLLCLAGSALAGCGAEPAATAPIEVTDARVRALIPGQDKTVGYFELTNNTTATLTLLSAEADAARAIEFHTTRLDDGIMRMRRLPEITIPAGETIRFQPGGNHLMLFGVRSLNTDNPVRLYFDDGRALTVQFRQIAIGEQ